MRYHGVSLILCLYSDFHMQADSTLMEPTGGKLSCSSSLIWMIVEPPLFYETLCWFILSAQVY